MAPPCNLNFNHVAISVPDAEKAAKWYQTVFGFEALCPLIHMKKSGPEGQFMTAVYGEDLEELKLINLTTGNGVGFEVLEFIKPQYDTSSENATWGPKSYACGGFFHICLTVPDVDKLADEVVQQGGRRIGITIQAAKSDKAVFVQDPWFNTIELVSCGFELIAYKRALGM